MDTNSSQFEGLAWEGLINLPTAAAIAVLLALLAAWALWRERHAVGRGWAVAFWVLRMVAFGCALWMLTGPVWHRTHRISTNQSVAIFADNSDSMEVVDPAEAADSVRWALAVSGSADDSPMARCDRLTVALGAAWAGGQQFANYLKEHRSAEQMTRLHKSISAAIERASGHAEAILDGLKGESLLADRASLIAALLDGPIGDSLTSIGASLGDTQRAVNEDFSARLESLLENITGARRRASVLATELAAQSSGSTTAARADVERLSRREKAARVLDVFEQDLKDQLDDDVRVRRYQFVSRPSPVTPNEEGWKSVLRPTSSSESAGSSLPFERDKSLDASGDADHQGATNLSAVLQQLSDDHSSQSTRMALIWSDGRHNDPTAPPPQEVAASLGNLPIFIVPIGNSAVLRDLVLHRVEAPTAVAEKDSAVIDVIVTGFECDGEFTEIVLRQEGREVDRRPVEFSGERSDARIRFTVPAEKAGRQEYIVEVQPLADEINSANNYMPVAFDVVRDRVRVLLADSVARWEFRYLSHLFRRDTHVEFDELLFFPRIYGTGQLAQRPELPRDVAAWARYDVVILGDLNAQQLPQASQRGLDEFVRERGGNLIVIAGRDAMPTSFVGMPFMELMPVEHSDKITPPEGFGLRLTDEGRFHPALMIDESEAGSRQAWQQIYGRQLLFWLSEYSRPKSTARSLIEPMAVSDGDLNQEGQPQDGSPSFLCWQRVGAGRVMYLAAPEIWRLRFRQGDRMHHRFWGQMLRWITAAGAGAGTDLVRLQTDRMRYGAGEPVEITAWLKDKTGRPLAGQAIRAEARAFDDAAVTIELSPDEGVPGRYFGTVDKLPAGAYHITVRGDVVDELLSSDPDTELVRATITVRASDNVEMLNTQCNRALLEQLAQVTGGQVIPPTAVSEVLKLISLAPEVVENTERTPLWNRWSNMLIVLGCLFTEWVVRKTKGLV